MRHILVLAAILLLILGMAAISYSQEDPNCAGAPLPQLEVGGYGQVSEGDANNVRDQASREGTKIGEIAAGESFLVLEGPVCADGFNWWRVDYNGLIGWTVEGSGADYFVVPSDVPAPTATAMPPLPPVVYPLSADNSFAVGLQARVDVAGLNIRATPSRDAAVLSQTLANELVKIVGGSTEAEGFVWWQIQQEDGTVGWIVEHFVETDSFNSELLIQTLFPLCPYTSERLSFIAHPYVYTSARDGSQRCVLYKLQTSSVYTTWGRLKYMVNDAYWSPQGDALLFMDYAYQLSCCQYQLYSVSVDGAHLIPLTPNNYISWAEWSPDGQKIALVMNEQAWVMNRDGTNPVRLSDTTNEIEYIAWYPDNQRVFYTEVIRETDRGIQMGRPSHYIYHSVGIDLSNPQVLYRTENNIEARDFTLSADGTHLVALIGSFSADGDVGLGAYLIDTANWDSRILADTYWGYLWSPDGQYLLIGDEEKRLVTISTGETRSIGSIEPVSWSADGQKLYLTDGAGFALLDIATGEVTRYLEGEAAPLEEPDYMDYGIRSVREQGTD